MTTTAHPNTATPIADWRTARDADEKAAARDMCLVLGTFGLAATFGTLTVIASIAAIVAR